MRLSAIAKVTAALCTVGLLSACVKDAAPGKDGINGVSTFVTKADVVKTNANIAYAVYADSLVSAKQLATALQELVNKPSAVSLQAAKDAWIASREPYGQSEVYRFRGGPIDTVKADGSIGQDGDGPEGAINAWPLGEAIIDYVAPVVDGDAGPENAANALSNNIIADLKSYPQITPQVLRDLFEHGEDERNVTTGYHAIEFLLWGQDLNLDQTGSGDRDSSGGQRPVSDYLAIEGRCTSGSEPAPKVICQRRGQYLLAAAELLITDLALVVNAWEPVTGTHYQHFVSNVDDSLAKILEGMGRLSYGELAGERINIALVTDSQEDEHSCFSDNTHRDILLNAKGVQNSYQARYVKMNGEQVQGASIHDLLVVAGHHQLANKLRGSLEDTMTAAAVIDTKAKVGVPFDRLIQQGIQQPNIIAMIKALDVQTNNIEAAIKALNVKTNDLRQDTEQDI